MQGPTTPPPAPFSCTYSPNVAELLTQLQCSLAITTFQAGKLIIISPQSADELIQLPRTFKKPMGLAIDGRRMAIATKEEIVVLANARGLASNYPPKPGTYDSLFLPRAVYYTGEIDSHDMHWGEGGLYAVNTRFSCISIIDDHYSIRPYWAPPFIKEFVPTDLCHLNGMAMRDDKPRYATAFGVTTTPKGWREHILTGGILIDMESNEIVARDLPMPHSPRWFDGELYLLLSATGELVRINLESGKYDVVTRIEGFLRGMAKWGDYLFIGLSRLRKNASVFRDLPIAEKSIYCGVEIVHLPTGASVGNIRYQASVEELYDVQILHGSMRPNVLNHETDMHRRALNTPQFDFWSVEKGE